MKYKKNALMLIYTKRNLINNHHWEHGKLNIAITDGSHASDVRTFFKINKTFTAKDLK